MKLMNVGWMQGLILVGMAGLGSIEICAQDAPRTIVQNLTVPAEPPAAPAPAAQASGYMGLTVDLMAPDGKLVYIVSVVEGGPAAKGGLQADDVILEINRQKIGNLQDLDRLVRQPAGAKLEFKVRRKDVPQRFQITLGARPSPSTPGAEPASKERTTEGQPPTEPRIDAPSIDPPVTDELPPPVSPQAADRDADMATPAPRSGAEQSVLRRGSRPNLGIKVADAQRLSEADKRRFGVVVDTGAVISDISEGTPAARAGLPIGGVVVSVNGRRIGNAQDIVDLVRTFRPGEQIEVTYWEGDRMGRKNVRVGRTAVDVMPAAPDDAGAVPDNSPARLRRRDSDRPILNALGRILDDVLPPEPAPPTPAPPADAADATDAPSEAMLPPPPPPRTESTVELPDVDIEPPAAELPEPQADADEIKVLRKQAADMQQQLETLLRRIQELENKKQTPSNSGS